MGWQDHKKPEAEQGKTCTKDILTLRIQENVGETEAAKILMKELVSSIAAAGENGMKSSRAGLPVAGEGGRPNIIFGLRDGKRSISGISH